MFVFTRLPRGIKPAVVRAAVMCYSSGPGYDDEEPGYRRNLRNRRTKAYPYNPNAGFRHTLSVLEEGNADGKPIDPKDYDCDEKEYEDIVMKPMQSYHEYQSERQEQHRKMLFKKTQKKHFPVPQEVNLLTWAAKEQLKYLHDTDPETWTPAKLHQSFPISEAGVKKLLKSKFRPESKEEVAQHDQAVLRNWKQLNAGQKQGPISTVVGRDLASGKLDFESLDGNRQLPMPTPEWKNQNALLVSKPTQTGAIALPRGEFGAILAQYVAAGGKGLTLPESQAPKPDVDLIDRVESARTSTEDILGVDHRQQVSIEQFKKTMRDNIHKFKKSDPAVYDKFNTYWDERQVEESKAERRSSNRHRQEEEYEDGIFEYWNGNMQKYNADVESPDVVWDTPRMSTDRRHREAYVYEPRTGYQRPFGRYDETDSIEIPEGSRVDGAVWRKGNCYYDENGELLYRVPFVAEDGDK